MSVKAAAAWIISLVLPWTAEAKAFIEPFVGIAKLEFELENEFNDSVTQVVANGFFLGARAGFTFSKKYFLGGEYYQAGPFQFPDSDNEAKLTNRMFGFVLGADFKDIRISASYYPKDTFDSDQTSGTEAEIESQNVNAVRVGLGLPISNNRFRANFDVIFHMFEEEETDDVFFSSISKFTGQTAQVSLSFPFELAR